MSETLKYFLILLAIGIVLYIAWTFYSTREVAYMSILLYKNGDADAYLKELDSTSAKVFFSKKLRVLMSIDAWLMKDDKEKIQAAFDRADAYKLRPADRFLVQQKELTWYIGQNNPDKAKEVFAAMKKNYDKDLTKKQRKSHEAMMQDATYTNAIQLEHDGKYASELMTRAKSLKDDIPAGVTYYKAAQSYYLKGDKKQCQLALEKAEPKLRQTSYHESVETMLSSKDYSTILNIKA